ncbi:pyruvate kinase [Euryarchaeota archaeon ex4484_178]|nr:MAG: pyruvate kinase [Euryarchaeota archaeon ex4484_178]
MRLLTHRTKIVATMGPVSTNRGVLESMFRAGLNVVRINFAHGKLGEHERTIKLIRSVEEKFEMIVPVLGDLPGVKIRVGEIEGGFVELRRGDRIVLTVRKIKGNSREIPVDYEDFSKLVYSGDRIYMSDGFIVLRVEEKYDEDIVCRVISGGKLFSHKGINVPHTRVDVETPTKQDFEILDFMLDSKMDAVGLSFVGRAEDVLKVRKFLEERRGKMFIISKIERPLAVKNFDAILRASDGIMVARGDLGVETPIEKLPVLQKKLIRKASAVGKPVITATQMLESMTSERMPTRAEVTDVANAIIDGTDAVMLSEETAVGKYPVESVRMMAKIAKTTEKYLYSIWNEGIGYWEFGKEHENTSLSIKDAIARSVMAALSSVKVEYILTPTRNGETPRLISRFRPRQWILAFTPDPWVARTLQFSYGVQPFLGERNEEYIVRVLKERKMVKEGDMVLLTEARPIGKTVGTNTLRIFKIA